MDVWKKLSQYFRDGKTGLDFFLPSKTKVYEDNTVGIIFLGDRIPKTLVKTSGIFWWHGVRWLTNGSLGWCMRWLTPHFTVKRFSDPVRKTSQKSKKISTDSTLRVFHPRHPYRPGNPGIRKKTYGVLHSDLFSKHIDMLHTSYTCSAN